MALLSLPPDRQREIDAAALGAGWSPQRDEQWWWLWVPVVSTILIVIAFRTNEAFYRAWILPEGYGALELTQFLEAAAGFVIAILLLTRPYVRAWGLLKAAVIVFALATFYIAGEEHSWGQHFFNWQTPDYWSALNRQQETNLHNTFEAANHLPQLLLEVGILTGGIIMPLWQRLAGPFQNGVLKLFAPPSALVPAALCAGFFKIAKKIGDKDASLDLVTRPSEAMETFFYMFILFYLIVFARRIGALEQARSGKG